MVSVSAAFHRPDLALVPPAITHKKLQANVGLQEDVPERNAPLEPNGPIDPLRLISSLADRFLDNRLMSSKGFRRFVKYKLILLIASLVVIAIFTGAPFGLRPGPWDVYSASLWFTENAVQVARTTPSLKDNPATPDTIKSINR